MEFYTLSNLPPVYGKKEFPKSKFTYCFQYDKETGRKVLCKDKEIDFQDEIQMFERDCNIYNVINRYCYGDLNALNQVQSTFVDMTVVPKTMMDALNISLKMQNQFNALKPEIRAEFNNDFSQFVASFSNGKIKGVFEKFAPKADNSSSTKESEVPENE